MKRTLFLYTPGFIRNIVYMMQSSGYKIRDYYRWLARTNDFSRVTYRGSLVKTAKARLLLLIAWVVLIAGYMYGMANILPMSDFLAVLFGILVILVTPYIVALVLPLIVLLGNAFIQNPREKKLPSGRSIN